MGTKYYQNTKEKPSHTNVFYIDTGACFDGGKLTVLEVY